jgi:hypothetical protein
MDSTPAVGMSQDRGTADWKAEVDRRVAEVKDAALAWGATPTEPEGRLVSALLTVVLATASIAEAAEQRWNQAQADERKRLSDLCLATERTLTQARNGLIGLEVQRDVAINRFMETLMPLFADKLGGALALREKRWNTGLRLAWLSAAVGALLVAAGVGAGAVWWQTRDAVAGFRECLARPYFAGNEAWCRVTTWTGGGATAPAPPSGR